jgi:hypothetical protein
VTAATTHRSAVDFFAMYAATEGALVERLPEGAVLVLPESLQAAYRLPEDLGLTEDPEVAREEGYLLLASGHPLLRAAAKSVLQHGDAGHCHLPRQPGPAPSPRVLQSQARDGVQVDHGRIDIHSQPSTIYLTIVRVGAMLTFRLSIDEELQELADCWTLADGSEIPPDLVKRLSSSTAEPGPAPGAHAWAGEGVAVADARIRERAAERAAELAAQRSKRLVAQLVVVDDYYERLLASIEERSARTTEDRRHMLGAQSVATRVEWERRRAEVTDEMLPVAIVDPFRLHVFGVPAWRAPAVVTRGSRTYPLDLVWVPLFSSFLPPGCPSCGSRATLVAVKDRLGCRNCTTPDTTPEPVVPFDVAAPPPAPSTTPSPSAAQQERARATRVTPATAPEPAAPSAAKRPSGRAQKGSSGRVTPKGGPASGPDKTGDRLTRLIWESVLNDARLKQSQLVPWSPMAALVRLYGSAGPALAVGMHDTEEPRGYLSETGAEPITGLAETIGWLQTSRGRELRFVFEWRLDSGRLLSIAPWNLGVLGPALSASYGEAARARFRDLLVAPPFSPAPLEPAARLLLRQSSEWLGLGFASRCLAAWWYLFEGVPTEDRDDDVQAGDVLAAAVEAVVARRTGIRVTANGAAERYGCALTAARAEIKRVQALVKDVPNAGW